jgi:hypothetical protein
MAYSPSIYSQGSGVVIDPSGRGLNRAVVQGTGAGRRTVTPSAPAATPTQTQAPQSVSPIDIGIRGGTPPSETPPIDTAGIIADTPVVPGAGLGAPDTERIAALRTPSDAYLSLFKHDENGELLRDANGKLVPDVQAIMSLPPAKIQEIVSYEEGRTASLREYLQPYKDAGVFSENASFNSLYDSTAPGRFTGLQTMYEGATPTYLEASTRDDRAAQEASAGNDLIRMFGAWAGRGRSATMDSAAHDPQRGREISQAVTFNNRIDGALGEGLAAPIEAQYNTTGAISDELVNFLEPNLRRHGMVLGLGDESPETESYRLYRDYDDRYWEYLQTPEGKVELDSMPGILQVDQEM